MRDRFAFRREAHLTPSFTRNAAGGLRQVASELLAKEGIGGFFKGLVPALTRSFPANAACFLGMEVSRKFLDSLF